jgi:fibrillarin-like pre-rRNA processing protein
MRDLIKLSSLRSNIIPILADANKPVTYQALIGDIDLVYQDIAQRNQVDMFLKNMAFFNCTKGILMVKARSIDVTQSPQKIYRQVIQHITTTFGTITETITLLPYEKDHLAIYI